MIDRVVLYPLGDDPAEARLMYGQDVRESLKLLPDKCIHTVSTSPPYWGLRSYLSEGTMRLRRDLTPAEVKYVLQELAAAGVRPGTGK